jgi:hypothetical protein
MISKEVLSKILDRDILVYSIKGRKGSKVLKYSTGYADHNQHSINIYELVHKCILYAWDNMYEITPRVMGAEIICLKTGYQLHIIQREDIENPQPFDPRFTFKACEWILNNKDKK